MSAPGSRVSARDDKTAAMSDAAAVPESRASARDIREPRSAEKYTFFRKQTATWRGGRVGRPQRGRELAQRPSRLTGDKSRPGLELFSFLLEALPRNTRSFRNNLLHGGVAEWSKATVLKTVVSEMAPWVRIPPPPPIFTFCEIVGNCLGAKRLGMVFFRNLKGIFEIQNQSAVGNAEVRTNLFEKIPNPFGIFLLSVFFGLVGVF